VFAAMVLGCGATERGTNATWGPGASAVSNPDAGETGGSDDGDTDDDPFDTENPLDTDDASPDTEGPADPTDGQECAALTEEATTGLAPVDVIFVLDNSGSMDAEAAAVQANMNDFSQQIAAAGIDVHVVALSSYPGNGNGVCIAPPLGSGGCPATDNNPPGFTHVNQEIGSADSLFQLVGRHSAWKGAMRPDSVKHIVVVSDDNSAIPAALFDGMWTDLDPSYDPYTFHGIVALHDCSEAANVGQVYINLANTTGGVLGDLCDQNFQPVFDELSEQVVQTTPIGCSWEIPPPPEGMEFDPEKVNVELVTGGVVTEIGHVGGPPDCANVTDGWFYDNPAAPTRIHVCLQTCDKIQAATEARIDILFGCETQSAPPAG
jgi:hypothetical protein